MLITDFFLKPPSRFFRQRFRQTSEAIRAGRFLPGAAVAALVLSWWLAAPKSTRAEDVPGDVSSGGAATVPLVRATCNHFGVNTTIDGHPAFLMLDTGSPLTILDAGFYTRHLSADTARQAPAQQMRMATLNHQPTTVGWIDDVRAGEMRFGKMSVAVTNLSGISGADIHDYHGPVAVGILGADILARYGAVIDWNHRLVHFDADPAARLQFGQAALRDGWTAISMEFTTGHHFAVPCTMGQCSYHLIVDTGAALTQIDQSIWGTTGITQGGPRWYMTGLSSNTMVSPMILMNWRIGTFPMSNSAVVVGETRGSLFHETTRTPGRMVGMLGSDWLASRAGIIDICGLKLYLK